MSRLIGFDLDEISGVAAPANEHEGWLVMKSAVRPSDDELAALIDGEPGREAAAKTAAPADEPTPSGGGERVGPIAKARAAQDRLDRLAADRSRRERITKAAAMSRVLDTAEWSEAYGAVKGLFVSKWGAGVTSEPVEVPS